MATTNTTMEDSETHTSQTGGFSRNEDAPAAPQSVEQGFTDIAQEDDSAANPQSIDNAPENPDASQADAGTIEATSQPTTYEPTAEELEAAALFDQHNADTGAENSTTAMTAQEIADFELALAPPKRRGVPGVHRKSPRPGPTPRNTRVRLRRDLRLARIQQRSLARLRSRPVSSLFQRERPRWS